MITRGAQLLNCLLTKTNTNSYFFFNFLLEIKTKSFDFCRFVDEFTLSSLNSVSNRYFLTHLKQCSCQMTTSMV